MCTVGYLNLQMLNTLSQKSAVWWMPMELPLSFVFVQLCSLLSRKLWK